MMIFNIHFSSNKSLVPAATSVSLNTPALSSRPLQFGSSMARIDAMLPVMEIAGSTSDIEPGF